MKFAYDLAFIYIDLGDPWWKTAVTEMLRSAERILPHARFVQLTDSESPAHPWAHKVTRATTRCAVRELEQYKSFLIEDHLSKTELPTIYCGADNIWCGYETPDIPAGATATDVIGFKRVHFYGPQLRVPMIRFARAIDGGKQFDELAPTTVEQAELLIPPAPVPMMDLELPREINAGDPEFGKIEFNLQPQPPHPFVRQDVRPDA